MALTTRLIDCLRGLACDEHEKWTTAFEALGAAALKKAQDEIIEIHPLTRS
jgi:hypothetical protein